MSKPTPAQIKAMQDIKDNGYTYAQWITTDHLKSAGLIQADTESPKYGMFILTAKGADALRDATGPKQVGRPPKGDRAMTPAEKQAAYRERNSEGKPLTQSEMRHLMGQLHAWVQISANEGSPVAERMKGNTPKETIIAVTEWLRMEANDRSAIDPKKMCNL